MKNIKNKQFTALSQKQLSKIKGGGSAPKPKGQDADNEEGG